MKNLKKDILKHIMKRMELDWMVFQNRKLIQLMFVLLVVLNSCKNKPSAPTEDYNLKQLVLLQRDRKFEKANHLIDSLILKNKNNGKYYFQKGMIEFQLDDFKSAVVNFKKAYSLNYKKEDCLKLMKINQTFLNNQLKYDPTGKKYKKYLDSKKDSTVH